VSAPAASRSGDHEAVQHNDPPLSPYLKRAYAGQPLGQTSLTDTVRLILDKPRREPTAEYVRPDKAAPMAITTERA
jgi:hypothetical protein